MINQYSLKHTVQSKSLSQMSLGKDKENPIKWL
jgi:hypothetical protein